MPYKFLIAVFLLLVGSTVSLTQTTAFTYQGRLIDGSLPANAAYDLEFRLFSMASGGSPIGTVQHSGVSVSSGVFTVSLDFGDAFDGSPRWLEILVKPAGSPDPFTLLSPRQPIASAPYSIRALNAANAETSANADNLGGIPANQFVVTTDTRLSDARDPLPGSGNYIQNTITQQTGNFNIGGSGTLAGTLDAGLVTSNTHYSISDQRVLSIAGSANTFVGVLSGAANTSGNSNAFFGTQAGAANTSGNTNSFYGERAGAGNTNGFANSFFGSAAGLANTSGSANAFFGVNAGRSSATAANNSFFGAQAGFANTTGTNNSFFGRDAGVSNATGSGNSFFGRDAGRQTTGDNNSFFGLSAGANNTATANSFFGAFSGESNTTGQFNAFFGFGAGRVSNADSNSLFGDLAGRFNTSGSQNSFFGASAGLSNTTGAANSFFGQNAGSDNTTGGRNTFIGRWSGTNNTTGGDNTFIGFNSGLLNQTGTENVFVGIFAGGSNSTGSNNTVIGANAGLDVTNLQYATVIGADATASLSNTIQLGRSNGSDTVLVPGSLRLNTLAFSGSTDVCRNTGSLLLANCSSSLRYKSNIRSFGAGLNVVSRLQPIVFSWNTGGDEDVGFAAEEVNDIEPLLATRNVDGEIEGVKYKQITTVLVNAVKELSVENDSLKNEIAVQRSELASLRQALCRLAPTDAICKEEQE